MKKLMSVFVLATMLLTLGFASAVVPVCATFETTFVSGVITDATNANAPVDGASVTVTCNGHVQMTTSDSNGGYSAEFASSDCGYGDDVSVSATYDGLSGESSSVTWYTENSQIGCLEMIIDVACVDVPLVPEFGLVIGLTTALGALGAFFLVRRK